MIIKWSVSNIIEVLLCFRQYFYSIDTTRRKFSLNNKKRTDILLATNLQELLIMETRELSEEEMDKQILTAIFSMELQVLFNCYALENVVLGRIQPGGKIPYDQYMDTLDLRKHEKFMLRTAMNGRIIDEQECIIKQDLETYYRLFYVDQIELLFENAPKHKRVPEDEGVPPYKYGLQEYLQSLYELFKEIALTEVQPDFFDLIYQLSNKVELVGNYASIKRFVAAIKMKKLKQGSRIDRYIKSITYRSEYLNRLIKEHKGHYLLANNNTDSLNYKLALLSCFTFCNADNARLFELKIKEWERKHSLNN